MKILSRFILITFWLIYALAQGKGTNVVDMYFQSLPLGALLVISLMTKKVFLNFLNETSLISQGVFMITLGMLSMLFATVFLSVRFVFLHFLGLSLKESIEVVLCLGVLYLFVKMIVKHKVKSLKLTS